MDNLYSLLTLITVEINNLSQRENLAVLASNVILGTSASVLFALLFGTPRLHSTIKLWSETLTRLQWAITSYYIYLMVTYKDQSQFISVFWALSFAFVVFSGWFTRKITTEIQDLHNCDFTFEECPVKDRKQCKFPKAVVNSHDCLLPMSRGQFIRLLLPNFVCALLSLSVAIYTAILFFK